MKIQKLFREGRHSRIILKEDKTCGDFFEIAFYLTRPDLVIGEMSYKDYEGITPNAILKPSDKISVLDSPRREEILRKTLENQRAKKFITAVLI